jgi:hypothetical protein
MELVVSIALQPLDHCGDKPKRLYLVEKLIFRSAGNPHFTFEVFVPGNG